MIEWLFSWEVTSVIVVALASFGLAVLALDDFRWARLFFLLAAADAIGGTVMGMTKTGLPDWLRISIVFVLVGTIGVLADQSLKYVDRKQKAKTRKPPLERTAKLAVMIPFDTAPKSAPIPLDENPDDPLFRTYSEFQSLAMHGTVPDDLRNTVEKGRIRWEARAISTVEAPSFIAQMLQYYIFHTIDTLQRDSMTIALGYPAQAKAGIEPPDAEPYSLDRLTKEIGQNVFFKPFLHRESGDEMAWRIKPVRMPRGTEIQFLRDSDDHVVRLHRPDYYSVDFSVRTFSGTGVGSIPKYFVTSHASTTMQWTFIVTMRYSIEQREDSALNPGLYAQWLDSVFDGLHKKLTLE